VNRGFATTSVQSKKQKEEAAALAEQQAAEAAEKAQAADEASKAVQAPVNGVEAEVSKAVGVAGVEDWEREDVADEGILQGLVDRLQEKGDKEVARIVKVSYDQPNCVYMS
jgi:ATP-dependent RNA helicase DHX29